MKNEDVIKILKQKRDFVSGTVIAATLGTTRAALWKRINSLRQRGYIIEASPAKGYRLVRSPELSIEEIKNSLSKKTKVIGREIIFFNTINSTNTKAMELAEKGYPEGTVVIADEQTAGKGRLGRVWMSPPAKNLYMSVVLKPELPPKEATLLTLMSAVACTSAVRKLTFLQAAIKWPNDLMVADKKLGGILTEIKAEIDRIFYAVIGIGLNVNLGIEDLPKEIKGFATSVKHETGESQSRTDFAVKILGELENWYNILLNAGKKPVIDEWLLLTSTIGRLVRVTSGEKVFTGVAEGIDDEGILILKLPDNSLKKISAGDITHVRATEQ